MKIRHVLLPLLAFFSFAAAVRAHDPGLSSATVRLGADRVDVVVTFATADIDALRAAEGGKSLEALASGAFGVSQAGKPLESLDSSASSDDQNNVEFRLAFAGPGDAPVTVKSPLIARLAPGHRQYLSVIDGNGQASAGELLSAAADSKEINWRVVDPSSRESAGPPLPGFGGFVLLGIEHILIGWDHLLFLAVLLLVARSFVDALKLITAFTVAHSITLALATFNLVQVPASVVEPLIAASIVYVAIENVIRRGEPSGRWILTAALGLVHGLGFASVLRDLGIASGAAGVWQPLLGFNLGVEIGQLSVAAVVLPVFLTLRRNPVWLRRWVPVGSVLIALMGGYWLVERVWLG